MVAEVFRDRQGVPHLRADSVEELARLQGHTVALDRAWQIEWQRRRAEGRTAEIVGPAGLTFDRFARRAEIDAIARRCFGNLDDRTQAWVAAFTDGVNAGLPDGAAGAYEFESLGIGPGSWQPWSPLSVFSVQQVIFGGFGYKLWRRHVAQRLGAETIDLLDSEIPDSIGSNAWAVCGHRSASGLPIVAGDPHRQADFPGVYQQVRLACPEFDVFGFTFPGVPGVQHFAHAGEVAWAITNAMSDYQDLYEEELQRTGDQVTARGPGGAEPVQRRVEVIEVRDGDPEQLEILITRRGPVIIDEEAGPTFSLRTPAMVENDLGFGALLPLLRSRTVDDVITALRSWVEPVNSGIVADRSGAVRHVVPGRVPLRDPLNVDLPVPAWDPRYSWTGTYAAMPVEVVDDLVANGNDRASGGGLGKYYAPGWRAGRVTARLRELTAAGVADMESIHGDTWLGPARLAQELLQRAEVDGPARSIQAELLAWDGQMAADSRGALLYATWRAAMTDWIAAQPPFVALRDPDPLPGMYAATMDVRIRIGVAFDAICRNADKFGLELDSGVAVALEAVAAAAPLGVWGDVHRLAPVHGLTGLAEDHVPPLPYPGLGGDGNCVRSTHSTPGVTHWCSMASMARYVWDLADPANSRWVVPYGASGRPGHPHHVDQTDAWASAELYPVVLDWTELIKES
ncbi:MAG: penicillin acylase family protein [Microlunatus sp.]|nr:penicillin acylase family protein [Microlunatus sp.]